MLENRGKLPAERRGEIDLGEELMLTAGGGEDHVGLQPRGGGQHDIGGDVAGMERQHKRGLPLREKGGDVAAAEGQSLPAEPFCKRRAESDDVGLTVRADHRDLPFLDDREIPIGGEGEIAFAAAEIQHLQHALLRKPRKDLINILKETVDLTEFRALAVIDPPVGITDAEGDEKVTGRAFRQDVLFASVMRGRGDPLPALGISENGELSFGGALSLRVAARREDVHLSVAVKYGKQRLRRLLLHEIAVIGLAVGSKGLKLKTGAVLQRDPAAFRPENASVKGAAEDDLFQGVLPDDLPKQGKKLF